MSLPRVSGPHKGRVRLPVLRRVKATEASKAAPCCWRPLPRIAMPLLGIARMLRAVREGT